MRVLAFTPKQILSVVAVTTLGVVASAVAVDAIYFTTDPGSPIESGIDPDLWAEIDGGSLTAVSQN